MTCTLICQFSERTRCYWGLLAGCAWVMSGGCDGLARQPGRDYSMTLQLPAQSEFVQHPTPIQIGVKVSGCERYQLQLQRLVNDQISAVGHPFRDPTEADTGIAAWQIGDQDDGIRLSIPMAWLHTGCVQFGDAAPECTHRYQITCTCQSDGRQLVSSPFLWTVIDFERYYPIEGLMAPLSLWSSGAKLYSVGYSSITQHIDEETQRNHFNIVDPRAIVRLVEGEHEVCVAVGCPQDDCGPFLAEGSSLSAVQTHIRCYLKQDHQLQEPAEVLVVPSYPRHMVFDAQHHLLVLSSYREHTLISRFAPNEQREVVVVAEMLLAGGWFPVNEAGELGFLALPPSNRFHQRFIVDGQGRVVSTLSSVDPIRASLASADGSQLAILTTKELLLYSLHNGAIGAVQRQAVTLPVLRLEGDNLPFEALLDLPQGADERPYWRPHTLMAPEAGLVFGDETLLLFVHGYGGAPNEHYEIWGVGFERHAATLMQRHSVRWRWPRESNERFLMPIYRQNDEFIFTTPNEIMVIGPTGQQYFGFAWQWDGHGGNSQFSNPAIFASNRLLAPMESGVVVFSSDW